MGNEATGGAADGGAPAGGTGGAPAYEIKAPEGVAFDPNFVKSLTPIAQELKLAPEHAAKIAALVKAPEALPESYKVTAPEGVEIAQPLAEAFMPVAKELGLNQKQFDGLVGAYASTILPQLAQHQASLFNNQVEAWGKAAATDKEFGGQQLDANLTVAARTIAKFGTPELKQLLDTTGLGNHPEVIRMFLKIGKTISEPSELERGGSAPGAKKTLEETFYPTSTTTQ